MFAIWNYWMIENTLQFGNLVSLFSFFSSLFELGKSGICELNYVLCFCTVLYWQTTEPFLASCGSATTFLPSIVIISLGGEEASRSVAVYLCVHIMWLHVFLLSIRGGAKEGLWTLIVALPRDLFISFFETWECELYISIL